MILYVKEEFKILETKFYRNQNFEAIYTCIHPHDSPQIFHILITYASPKCSFQHITDNLTTCLQSYQPTETYVILGDFNMNTIVGGEKYNDKIEQYFSQEYNMRQMVTQETTDYHTKLDLVFTNSHQVDHTGVIDNCWSDHKLIYTALPML